MMRSHPSDVLGTVLSLRSLHWWDSGDLGVWDLVFFSCEMLRLLGGFETLSRPVRWMRVRRRQGSGLLWADANSDNVAIQGLTGVYLRRLSMSFTPTGRLCPRPS
eukprot:2326288-Rhodomonas_salina.2